MLRTGLLRSSKTSSASGAAPPAADDTLQDPLSAAPAAGGDTAKKPGLMRRLKTMIMGGGKQADTIPDPAAIARAGKVLDHVHGVQGQLNNLATRVPQAIAERSAGMDDAKPEIVSKLTQIQVLVGQAQGEVSRVEDAYYTLADGGSLQAFRMTLTAAMGTFAELRAALSGHDGSGDGLTIGDGGVLLNPMTDAKGGEQVMSEGAYGALKKGQDHRTGATGAVDGAGQLSRGMNTPANMSITVTYGPAYLKNVDLLFAAAKQI